MQKYYYVVVTSELGFDIEVFEASKCEDRPVNKAVPILSPFTDTKEDVHDRTFYFTSEMTLFYANAQEDVLRKKYNERRKFFRSVHESMLELKRLYAELSQKKCTHALNFKQDFLA